MADTVQVWKIPLAVSDDVLATYTQCLSEDERSRANRFRFTHDRRKFIVARGTLRHLLAKQFDQPPAMLEFCYGDYGKPGLTAAALAQSKSGECDFHFNLSHSGELALCALGLSAPGRHRH